MCKDFKIDAFIKIWIMVCMIEYWIVCKAMLMFGIEMYTGTSYVGWLPIITRFWWVCKDAVWYSNNSITFQTLWVIMIPKARCSCEWIPSVVHLYCHQRMNHKSISAKKYGTKLETVVPKSQAGSNSWCVHWMQSTTSV